MGNNSELIRNLFDLQHFCESSELKELIDQTMSRCGRTRAELSDSDVENLNAAGSAYSTLHTEQEI